jgi:hypothetical protein
MPKFIPEKHFVGYSVSSSRTRPTSFSAFFVGVSAKKLIRMGIAI